MVLEIQADNVDLKAENVKMSTEFELLKENQKLTAQRAESKGILAFPNFSNRGLNTFHVTRTYYEMFT